MEFIYQFSIYKGYHKLGKQVKFHSLLGGRLFPQLVAPGRTLACSIRCTEQDQPVYAIKNSRLVVYVCANVK